ncbi:MAG: 3-deoxy-8-phosphooctulonate synthase [Candidatus Pelagibacter sp.]|nr:3-deoxy-8-phosphooctulonate synthase [Candidatus Pelagibacter sp.]OUW11658.1 MAG: 3-deoxy-8-phosphooctulonate synthase [Candidatus Pelagibacter sp. TMED166]|tara:strand:- start:23053 stop:23883 length:831 start_codon:yes stop_codon:yes gene_type:complete
MKNNKINCNDIIFSNDVDFCLISGPCQIESENHALDIAGKLKEIAIKNNVKFVFKSSFDKANRTSINSKRGLGLEKSLKIFEKIKKEFNLNILTDVHTSEQCSIVAKYVDIIQIPAFLCRQTDLLVSAAKTNKVINIKKGQFLAPWDITNVINKVTESGNKNILLTERGTSFGYNSLVADMRSLPIMKKTGFPVIFDATHSVQLPGGKGGISDGQREFINPLSKAAISIGIAGIFIETHEDPDNAPSDGPNMLHLKNLEKLIVQLSKIDSLIKSGE